MELLKNLCLFGISFGVVLCTACLVHAESIVTFAQSPLWISSQNIVEGESVTVSTVVIKNTAQSVRGSVTFVSRDVSIGTADFSLPSEQSSVVVSVSWVPPPGTHPVAAKISHVTEGEDGAPLGASTAQIQLRDGVVVHADTDRDRIVDSEDVDDDNDGVSDLEEKKNGTNPTVSERTPAMPKVAGVATTTEGIITQVSTIASSTKAAVMLSTETFRLNGARYFDMKLKEAEEARAKKIQETNTLPSIDDIAEKKMLPVSVQISDASGIVEGMKVQAYRLGSQLFTNIYAFYLVLIFLILWIVRKIWKRFSLT